MQSKALAILGNAITVFHYFSNLGVLNSISKELTLAIPVVQFRGLFITFLVLEQDINTIMFSFLRDNSQCLGIRE